MRNIDLQPDHIRSIIQDLKDGKSITEKLPSQGKLKIENNLPFLLIYRYKSLPLRQTVRLVMGESSYFVSSGSDEAIEESRELLMAIAKTLSVSFGAVMFLEVWEGEPDSREFKIKAPKDLAKATVNTLLAELDDLSKKFPGVKVGLEYSNKRYPETLSPLLNISQCQEVGCFLIGLEIPPFYRSVKGDEFYYLYFRALKKRLSSVFRKTIFQFLRTQTSSDIDSYHALGSRTLEPVVWEVDNHLAEIEQAYRFLLLISPINTLKARDEFARSNFKNNPEFLYRILPIDPDHLKEQLYQINVRAIEDPTLSFLYREKREELDKQITMLGERGTKHFMYSSIRLYESVDPELLEKAKGILTRFPSLHTKTTEWADCYELARAAREEINWYKQFYAPLDATVTIKPDIIGIMVSKGQVLIGESFKVPKTRVESLIHHEVGTHVLTYYNGKSQPLKLLYSGFADYDELQEGLAVLAEYLTGGLTRGRLRLLAARVIAGHSLTEGADFCGTFHELHHDYGFELGTAFDVTARIHQGGGCTKDIIYLRGLIQLMDYLKNGGKLEPLYVGKIAQKHVPFMEELHHRNILRPIPLLPRFLQHQDALKRLELVKDGITVENLIPT
ncbi:MAG TPA: tyrosine/phenylalanine carboxypeptidase domain-containing protein [Cyclobacteriaceae bacterium]|nr:tyrosine/phenylalanine carboxypeptidase domain-containing protein [Cyclobacteriaceae bacterium]